MSVLLFWYNWSICHGCHWAECQSVENDFQEHPGVQMGLIRDIKWHLAQQCYYNALTLANRLLANSEQPTNNIVANITTHINSRQCHRSSLRYFFHWRTDFAFFTHLTDTGWIGFTNFSRLTSFAGIDADFLIGADWCCLILTQVRAHPHPLYVHSSLE